MTISMVDHYLAQETRPYYLKCMGTWQRSGINVCQRNPHMKPGLSSPTVKEIPEFSTSPQNPKKDKILKTGIANILTWDFRVKIETGKGAATLPHVTFCDLFG